MRWPGSPPPRKTLPCKWLYDAEGCSLFEAITRLPEYYPTRTEVKILAEQAPAIAAAVGPGRAVVEFGPGDGAKAALLLGGLEAPAAYVPVDIAPEWLEGAANRVVAAHPGLPVLPVVADFTLPFALPKRLGTAAAARLLPRLHHRQFRAGGRHRLPPPRPCDAGRRVAHAARRRSGEGQGGAGGGL